MVRQGAQQLCGFAIKTWTANSLERWQKRIELIEAQGFRCALTGRTLKPEDAALDHKVAVSRGGEARAVENLQWVHHEINRMKNTMSNAEFIAACREVVAWADSTSKK